MAKKTAEKRIEIFRAGERTDSRGTTLRFSEADLKRTAEVYDPALHEAPIVVGHPKDNATPAFGWVQSVEAEGASLFSEVAQLDPGFVAFVEAGRYKKVSASFYLPDAAANPVPGTYYLRHVGFLGGEPPAVKGLAPVEFAEEAGDVLTVEFGEEDARDIRKIAGMLSDVGQALQRIREWFIETDGREAADDALPSWTLDWLTHGASDVYGRAGARLPDDETSFTETEEGQHPMTNDTKDAPKGDPAAGEDLARRAAELERREADFAEREAAAGRRETEGFVDGLVKAGKIPARQRDNVVSFMEALPRGETAEFVEFGEDGKAAKAERSPYDQFRRMAEAMPALVTFGEFAKPEDTTSGTGPARLDLPAGYAVDPDAQAVHDQAVAYAEAKGVGYLDAVTAIQNGAR
jgi:hypothetical protein